MRQKSAHSPRVTQRLRAQAGFQDISVHVHGHRGSVWRLVIHKVSARRKFGLQSLRETQTKQTSDIALLFHKMALWHTQTATRVFGGFFDSFGMRCPVEEPDRPQGHTSSEFLKRLSVISLKANFCFCRGGQGVAAVHQQEHKIFTFLREILTSFLEVSFS